jgi:type 1 glutamine amidotransferase
MLRRVAMCAVVLVAPPLTLAQTINDTEKPWLRAAIVALTWTLGAGVGTVLSSDLGREEERDDQD